MTNAIRPGVAVSRLANDEAQTRESGRPSTLRGSVTKRCWGASGGWRRNDGKVGYMNQGDLSGGPPVFMLVEQPKSRPLRSQSVHSSDEAG